jgi:hypothetical protein
MDVNEEVCMAMGTMGEHRGDPAERGGAGVLPGRPVLVHHLLAKHGDEGLEVLRILLDEKGETLPVFSAGWVARGYLFAEAPGGGWYVKTYTSGELVSLLVGLCAGVEWVALDPRPGHSHGGEVANVMPRENFVDYLLCSRAPCGSEGTSPRLSGVSRMDQRTIGSERQEALGR